MLELEVTNIPAQVKKECTCVSTLNAGEDASAKIGEDELDEVVPQGKRWDVVFNIRIVETDV